MLKLVRTYRAEAPSYLQIATYYVGLKQVGLKKIFKILHEKIAGGFWNMLLRLQT